MDTLRVELGPNSYDIKVGSALLTSDHLAKALPMKRVCIVTDQHVAEHYLAPLQQKLEQQNIAYHAIILPAGEATKSIGQLSALIDQIMAHNPERNMTLIALGGGVVGDITGFAASIILRGIPFIQIPTTLLAQVDSSVGGKTGINHSTGKNLIGSFYQPKLVLIDTDTLATLPKRELRAGYAEMLKYALIGDRDFFYYLEQHADALLAGQNEYLVAALLKCCRMKADIVSQDEKESGVRALLNLGHTFGHALEAEMGYGDRLRHGEAVSVGMVMAFEFSVQLGLCSQEDLEQIRHHLQQRGLPVSPYDIADHWDSNQLIEHMQHDKKIDRGQMVFILANAIGDSFIHKQISLEQLQHFMQTTMTR